MNELQNLGYVNGWRGDEPEIYKLCLESRNAGEQHEMEYRKAGRCVSMTICHTCWYFYKVDSSD